MFTAISPELLATTLRSLRTGAGMSQAALAKHAGINTETVSRIENGKGTTFTTFGKIATVLPALHQLNGGGSGVAPPGTIPREDLTDLKEQISHLIYAMKTRDSLETARMELLTLLTREQQMLALPTPKRRRGREN